MDYFGARYGQPNRWCLGPLEELVATWAELTFAEAPRPRRLGRKPRGFASAVAEVNRASPPGYRDFLLMAERRRAERIVADVTASIAGRPIWAGRGQTRRRRRSGTCRFSGTEHATSRRRLACCRRRSVESPSTHLSGGSPQLARRYVQVVSTGKLSCPMAAAVPTQSLQRICTRRRPVALPGFWRSGTWEAVRPHSRGHLPSVANAVCHCLGSEDACERTNGAAEATRTQRRRVESGQRVASPASRARAGVCNWPRVKSESPGRMRSRRPADLRKKPQQMGEEGVVRVGACRIVVGV